MNGIQNWGAVALGGLVVVGTILVSRKTEKYFVKQAEKKLGLTLGTINTLENLSSSLVNRTEALTGEAEKLIPRVVESWNKLKKEDKNDIINRLTSENSEVKPENRKTNAVKDSIEKLKNLNKEMLLLNDFAALQTSFLLNNSQSPKEEYLNSWAPYLKKYAIKLRTAQCASCCLRNILVDYYRKSGAKILETDREYGESLATLLSL